MPLACLGKPGRSLWRSRDADIPRSWGDSPCEKKILLHISHQFFYGIHLPENQLYYADQQEMGWKKNQENMENSKHILASLHVFFFSAVATETKTFVIKNDDM